MSRQSVINGDVGCGYAGGGAWLGVVCPPKRKGVDNGDAVFDGAPKIDVLLGSEAATGAEVLPKVPPNTGLDTSEAGFGSTVAPKPKPVDLIGVFVYDD